MDSGKKLISNEKGAPILQQIAKALTSTLDLQEVLNKIMSIIADLFEPKDWSLLMLDEETEELYFAVAVGEASEKIKSLRLKLGEGIAGWVAKNAKPLITEDAYKDPRFARWVDSLSGFKTKTVICVPLVSKGKTLGVIELFNIAKEKFKEEELNLLGALADFAAIAIENAKFVQKIKALTIVDDVTGLYNSRHLHTLLETEISRSIRYRNSFSIIFLDLDHFKNVNDSYGHLIGSRILAEVGQLFKYNLRTIDWSVRYGGDEFVLILPRTQAKEAMLVCQRLRKILNQTEFLQKEGLNIRITASFGIATFPDDAKDKEELIKKADQAMYYVKRTTRDGICSASMIKGQ